jgi:hypothetical protein
MSKLPFSRASSKWSEIFLCAAIGLGPLLLAGSCFAQLAQASGRSAIEPSQVFQAMRDRSLPTDGSRIEFAAPVSSSVASARLVVESVSLLGDREVRMRLACADHNACLPFFAIASYAEAVDASAFHKDKVTKTLLDAKAESTAKMPQTAPVLPKALDGTKDATILKAGAPATLELETDRIHVRVEVISLQNGAPGKRVRVSSLDHKQTYVAQVVTPTLVKGEISQ